MIIYSQYQFKLKSQNIHETNTRTKQKLNNFLLLKKKKKEAEEEEEDQTG